MPDLFLYPGQILCALQCVGGVTAVAHGFGILLQLGPHLVAAAAQVGQFCLQPSVFPLGEACCSGVGSHG
jgi:hypothetical protein